MFKVGDKVVAENPFGGPVRGTVTHLVSIINWVIVTDSKGRSIPFEHKDVRKLEISLENK